MPTRERRHHQRLQFEQPLAAQFANLSVELADLSLRGARIIHVQPLQTGRTGPLRFHWLEHHVTVEAEVVRCKIDRMADAQGANLYSSGLLYSRVRETEGDPLRELVEEHVVQAVREQIANARGTFIPLGERMALFRSEERLSILPPPGERSRASTSFLSCALTEKGWRKIATSDPAQPLEGFTVSALEDSDHVEMLCRTYQRVGEQDRRLIRMLAEISIEGSKRPSGD